jgi:hypothetical protein
MTRLGGISAGLATTIGFSEPPPQPATQSKNTDTNTNGILFFTVRSPFYYFNEFCKIAGNQQTIFSFLSRPNLQFCRSLYHFTQDILRSFIHLHFQQTDYTESARPEQVPRRAPPKMSSGFSVETP